MPNCPAWIDICAKEDYPGVEKRQHHKSSVVTGKCVSLRRQILYQLIQQNVTFHIKRPAPPVRRGKLVRCFFATRILDRRWIHPIIVAMKKRSKQQSENSCVNAHSPSGHVTDDRSGSALLGQSIVQSLPIGVVAFDADLRIIEANSQAATLVDLGDHIDKSLARGTDEKIWLGWTQQLKSVISTGETCLFDDVAYTFNERTRLLRIICSPLNEVATAKNLGGTMIIEDITEKVNIQRRLANAERLATVGKHASKVAHELNNPLDGILRYINLAMRIVEQEKLEKPKEYLTQCRQGLMRMVQIVSELLEFSRSTYTPLEHVKIEQIIEDALQDHGVRTQKPQIFGSCENTPLACHKSEAAICFRYSAILQRTPWRRCRTAGS